jgi:hypothetical protein
LVLIFIFISRLSFVFFFFFFCYSFGVLEGAFDFFLHLGWAGWFKQAFLVCIFLAFLMNTHTDIFDGNT